MKNRNRLVAALLCTVFALSALLLAGCGLKEDEKGANIQVYLADFPQTLDPALVQANPDANQILSLIFEPLTKMGDNGKVSGALAKKWYGKYDKVKEEYALFFEMNASFWSNSYTVTADDVIYAWKRILDPDTESPYASLLYCIKNAKAVKAGIMTSDDLGITAEDDLLLKVVFEDAKSFTEEEAAELGIKAYVSDEKSFEIACDQFVETVSNIHLSPVREDVVKRYKDYTVESDKDHVYQWGDYSAASIVSNGYFKVQAYERGKKLVLERNTYYRYDEDNALDKYVKAYRLTCYFYEGQYQYSTNEGGMTQEEYQAKRYQNGEIYWLGKFSNATAEQYSADAKSNRTLNGFGFLFNTQTIPDVNVRKALAAAVDRNEAAKLLPNATAATGFVPSGVFDTGRGTDFRSVGGNLYANDSKESAKAVLGSSKTGALKLVYLIPYDITEYDDYRTLRSDLKYEYAYEKIAEYAVSCWNEIGIKVEAKGLVYKDYLAALQASDFDIIGYNFIYDSTDALAYLAPFARMYSGRTVSISLDSNSYTPGYTLLEDDEYDALVDKAAYTADRSARASALHEVEAKFQELCPATMLFTYDYRYVTSSKLSGIGSVDYYGTFDLMSVKLSNWREVNASEEAVSTSLEEAHESN
ncbi:MAG: hypothetical protein J5843_04490 [Clostridia bacterium]|nr:hypothetical protein [Clostridia bacterium]